MLAIKFLPFQTLETQRLFLRQITTSDAASILALRGNKKTMQYIPRPLAKNTEDALAHIATIEAKIVANEGINWGITLKNSNELIGIIGFFRISFENYRAEIGYMLLPDFQGQGISTEAIAICLQYGFTTMKLHSVEAVIDPRNRASERVLEKNNFIKEAHFIENEYYNGVFLDTVIYSLLKSSLKQ